MRLEKVRLDRSALVEGTFSTALAVREYTQAFEQFGLTVAAGTDQPAIARLQQSAIKEHLVAALDDWASPPISCAARAAPDSGVGTAGGAASAPGQDP